MDNIKFIAVKVMDDEDGGTLGRPVWTVEWIDKIYIYIYIYFNPWGMEVVFELPFCS